MSTEPRKFIELGSDLLVKTTSFQKAANGRYNTRKKKSQEFSGDSFVNSAWQAFLFSSLTTGSPRPSHIVNTTKTKDKENIGKTYVSSLWIFSPSLLYIQDLCNSYKNIQKDRIKKSCPWNHTRSSSFSVLMNNFSHLRWS